MSISLTRQNFRGRKVSLLGGPILVGLTVALQMRGASRFRDSNSRRVAIAALGSGAAGLYDDLADEMPQNKSTKGLGGHFHALREGRVSPGLVKMFALLLTGLLAAKPRQRFLDYLLESAVIAGSANLINLTDLRPGRALKTGVFFSLAGFWPSPRGCQRLRMLRSGRNLLAIAALFPTDLREVTMLGDTGANALGAALGSTWAQGRSTESKLFALLSIAALTIASERISFSKVINENQVLHRIDQLGRIPL